jgi:uncharacterized protein (DUF433 family)
MSTAISLPLAPEPPPIALDAGGVPRIGGTRVTLDSVVASYLQGNSVETIAEQYDTLSLPDIHAVIAFYLRHKDVVDAYLEETEELAQRLWREQQADPAFIAMRNRLLERSRKMG